MSKEQVRTYLGDTIENLAERSVLARLQDDLAARSIRARIFANFYTTRRRNQRQIDLFVITPHRATLIELKTFNPSYPLVAPLNGPWRQILPDGQERALDGNANHQARQATFALSDDMRRLADAGEVPPEKHFYTCVDTVICIAPSVPAGSTIDRADHVTTLGYDQLVDRLASPGPRPPWNDEHWDRLILQLKLYPEESVQPDPTVLHRVELQDYCRRFVRGRSRALHELVRLDAQINGRADQPLDLISYAREGRTVTVVGPSGAGKTHAVTHAAVELAQMGHLVVWARCDEYRSKQLSLLLARAVAPYSTTDPRALIDTAIAAGREAILVLDGLNECDADVRALLLEQLASLRLRHTLSVILTSTDPVNPVDEALVTEVQTVLPTVKQRVALLRSHGANPSDEHARGFTTPFELSLLAECARDIGLDATHAELYDAFVSRRCGALQHRAVLRQIARQLDEQMTSSLPIRAVVAALERSAEPPSLETIDEVLGNPLLRVEQGWLRFSHDLLARFLSADELVHRARSGNELATLLDDPRHRDLTDFVLDLETQPVRRYELLRNLSNGELLRAGLLGRFGDEVRSRLHNDAHTVFATAKKITPGAWLETPPVGERELHSERWHLAEPLDVFSRGLIVAAARCVDYGLFIEDIAALLQVTDQKIDHVVAVLRAEGFKTPLSAVVGSTYGIFRHTDEMLPASMIADALQFHSRWPGRERGNVASATELFQSSYRHGWGLLHTALQVVDAEHSTDRVLFPELLTAAWSAGGYHLRLHALDTARYMAGPLQGSEQFDHVKDFLSQIEPSDWALNSLLMEVLAAYDGIEPLNSLAGIRNEIDEVLAAPPSNDSDSAAFRIFSSQFEDHRVLGPYYEAIETLDEQDRRRLLTMAVRGRSEYSMFGDTLLAELTQLARPEDLEILESLQLEAAQLRTDSGMAQESVGIHVLAVQGLSIFSAPLPAPGPGLPPAWQLIDQLILALANGDERELRAAGARCWPELLSSAAGTAIDALYNIAHAHGIVLRAGTTSTYGSLTAAFPVETHDLMAWGLAHPDSVVATSPLSHLDTHHRFIINELGRLGTPATATLLEPWVADPHLGDTAAAAIRELRRHRH